MHRPQGAIATTLEPSAEEEMIARLTALTGAALLATFLGLGIMPLQNGAFAADLTAVESCPRGQDINGLWMGVFRSTMSPPGVLNGGTVALMITQDPNVNHPGRRFMFTAEATNGMTASGDGTISASGNVQIKGDLSAVGTHAIIGVLRAAGDVNGCPQTENGDFHYDVMFTGGVRDQGDVTLVHCTLPAIQDPAPVCPSD
jgi:hypothetical protein